MDNNWQQISLLEAKFFTQSGKFQAVQEIDPFAMEEQKFLLKENNNIRFKVTNCKKDSSYNLVLTKRNLENKEEIIKKFSYVNTSSGIFEYNFNGRDFFLN